MPQDEDLAVDRVHAVEGLLEPDLPLGPDRRLAGAGQLAQEPGGQGPGAGAGHGAAVERDLAADVAAGRAEVPPVLLLHPLADQEPEPDVERHGRVADVLVEPPHRVEVALLDHVGGVDAALEPGVEAQRHHPPQPVAVALEQLDDGGPVARGGAGDKVGHLSWGWRHFIHSTHNTASFQRMGTEPIFFRIGAPQLSG